MSSSIAANVLRQQKEGGGGSTTTTTTTTTMTKLSQISRFYRPSRLLFLSIVILLAILVPALAVLDTLSADRRFQQSSYTLSPNAVSNNDSPFNYYAVPPTVQATASATNSTNAFNGLAVICNITSVDIPNGAFRSVFSFMPVGNFSLQSDISLTNFKRPNISMQVLLGSSTVVFNVGQPMAIQSLDIQFNTGNVNKYPFDEFASTFILAAFPYDPNGIIGIQDQRPIPILFAIVGASQGFLIAPTITSDASHPSSIFSTSIVANRSFTVQFFSLFIITAMWLISSGIFILCTTLWLRDRTAEPPTIGFVIGMLFALPTIRNSQPGVPAVGATIDLVSFFWNLGLVLFSTLVVIVNYIKKHQREGGISNANSMENFNKAV